MILTTKNYRVVCDRAARSLTIQCAVTWAPVSALEIPDEPGLAEAVIKAVQALAGQAVSGETAQADDASVPKKKPRKQSAAAE